MISYDIILCYKLLYDSPLHYTTYQYIISYDYIIGSAPPRISADARGVATERKAFEAVENVVTGNDQEQAPAAKDLSPSPDSCRQAFVVLCLSVFSSTWGNPEVITMNN